MRSHALFAILASVSALVYAQGPACLQTCMSTVSKGSCAASDVACLCNSDSYVGRISDCSESTCSSRVVEDAFAAFGDYCNTAPGATAAVTEALSSALTSIISSQVQAGIRPSSDLPPAQTPAAAAAPAAAQATTTAVVAAANAPAAADATATDTATTTRASRSASVDAASTGSGAAARSRSVASSFSGASYIVLSGSSSAASASASASTGGAGHVALNAGALVVAGLAAVAFSL